MKIRLLCFCIAIVLTFIFNCAYGQAPIISYSTPVNVYTVGTAIANLVPTNTGGVIASGTFPSTSLSGPSGMGVSPSGNLYVTQYNNGTITYYNSSGTLLGTFGSGFTNPDGIVFDAAGNAYIVDAGAAKVFKITTGNVKTTFVNTGLSSPLGIAIDASGNIYVTSTGANKILKYSTTGVLSLTITSNVSTPTDVRVDASGNIYVLNLGTNNVTKYNSAGTYTGVFASGFNAPYSLAISSAGNFYVGDSGNNRVVVYNSSGVQQSIISVTDPEGVVVDASLDVFVSSYSGNNVYEFPPSNGYSITGTLPAGLSFNTSTGVISGTPTASSAATNYTITGFNGFGSSSTTISIACGTSFVWRGTNSAVWTLGSNWNTGSAPSTNDAVTIGVTAYTGSKKEPIITTTVTVGSITFGNNGGNHTLTVTSPGILTIGASAVGLTVNTGVTPTVTGTGNVNIAAGGIINITGTGVLNTTLTGKFTLQSNATGSASVGPILTTSITGSGASSINVERYLTGGAGYRGYRLLSSPVYTANVVPNNVYSINYVKTNAFLTGTLGVTNGFDQTGNPTLYLFREDQAPSSSSFTNGNFWGISKINNGTVYNYFMNGGATNFNIPVGNGFMFFFRGSRSTTSPYNPGTVPLTSTLVAIGNLNIGQVIVHNWYTPTFATLGWTNATANSAVRGYNLVGNPYPSSIDWEQYSTTLPNTNGIYANNVGNTIYELNPATNNYDSYQVGGAFTNNGSETIVSGQAFFVIASNNTSPQLVFNESAKITTQNTGLNLFMADRATVASLNKTTVDQHLRLQLAEDDVNTDDIYIGFSTKANTQYIFNEDAPYKPGSGKVSLASISSDNLPLAINKLPLPKQSQSIPMYVSATADGTYRIKLLDLKGIPPLFDIWLMDRYKKDSIDLRHNLTYMFNLNTADTNSYGSHRFSLLIRQNEGLAVHLLAFTADKVRFGVQIAWKTENEKNYTNFTVERSTDNGATFDALAGILSSAQGNYSFLDAHPHIDANKYRLKLIDLNGAISYSNVVTLMYSNLSNGIATSNISVYPNPAGSVINLNIGQNNNLATNLPLSSGASSSSVLTGPSGLSGSQSFNSVPTLSAPSGNGISYTIKIVNIIGAVVKTAISYQTNWQGNVSNLSPGTYIIQVVNSRNNAPVGKGTFIKL